jgi:hypothetical protein
MAAPNNSTKTMTIASLYPSLTAAIGLKRAYFPIVLAGLAGTAKVVDNFTFGHAGRITDLRFIATIPASTASKAATITPSINGTNLTGGVLALTTANCTAGAIVNDTAITAGNTFDADDVFDLTLSSVTAFSEGSGVIEVTYYDDDQRAVFAKSQMAFAA